MRGFRRGNNVNNTNLSPLYVNANNAPSNANTNIAFGNCKQAYGGSAAVTATPYKTSVAQTLASERQVQSLAEEESRTTQEKRPRPSADRAT